MMDETPRLIELTLSNSDLWKALTHGLCWMDLIPEGRYGALEGTFSQTHTTLKLLYEGKEGAK